MFNPTWFYTAAVYAAAVALARRAGVELPKRVAVFFYALVFVFLYLPLTQDYVNLPVDFLKSLIESFGIETSLDGPQVRGSGIQWGCNLYVRQADAPHAIRIVADFRAKRKGTID